MTDWTNIADSVLEPGDPVRSVDIIALRDNPIAIAEGASGAPEMAASQAALALLSSASANDDAAIEFTNVFNNDYDVYIVQIFGFQPASDNVALIMEFSKDGGTNWITTNDYYWVYIRWRTDGDGTTVDKEAHSNIKIGDDIDNGSTRNLGFTITLFDPVASLNTPIIYDGILCDINGHFWRVIGSGALNSSDSIDSMRFKTSSGNINRGEFYVYGVRK